MKLAKIDFLNILVFAALLAIFYPGLVIAKQASLMGDHWEQHYPWAFLMAQSLRQGTEPFWTPLIQCGFPIVAESQMGLFYIPNLLLYALLPIEWGYAYMNLLHFYIAAVGTYLYARKVGVNSWGAFVAAIVFVFGTGYGGAYYNITSLKTLSWFPWILWTFEVFLESFRKRYVLLAAFFMSLSVLAGYLQVAALMLLICAVYFLLRVFAFNEPSMMRGQRLKTCLWMVFAALVALAVSLPQLLLTSELASFSNRINLSEDYAYVGSLSPLALLTIIFPKLQGIFRGNCVYSGIFAVYFSLAAFYTTHKTLRQAFGLWATLGCVSLLLAFGGWSPLYVSLVKLTHFYSFRVPAKFLIFFCFSTAILSGLGVHVWSEELVKARDRFRSLNRIYLGFMAMMLAIWGIVYFFVTTGRPTALRAGKWVVTHFIYGKSGHPRTLESYFETVSGFINSVRDILAVRDPWQIWALVLIVLSCVWVWLVRRAWVRSLSATLCLVAAIAILLVDLYVFAGTDIKKDFDSYQNVLRPNRLVNVLMAEKGAGKVGRIYGCRRENESLPLVPSVNMIYGIEDIGGYSPFIMSRYFETIGQFGNVNDSNRMQEPDISFVLERLPLLNALDVSHILSTREIRHPDLEFLLQDPVSGARLYWNLADHARGYFIASAIAFSDWPNLKTMLMTPGFDPRKILLLENSDKSKLHDIRLNKDSRAIRLVRVTQESDREIWSVETTGPGFFVLASTMYPGWEANINDQKTALFSAYGLFRAVWIPSAGTYRVEFCYKPFHKLCLACLKR